MKVVRVFIARTVRATGHVVRDRRIPRPLRWFAGLALLPIPGPFDEAVLLVVAVPLFALYRRPLRDAWDRAAVAGATHTTAEVDDVSR
jgi:hypothetical protein